jgi:hypothetical protein
MGGWAENGPCGDWFGGDVVWIQLAQDRDHWWALVNAVMKLQVLVPWNKLFGYTLSNDVLVFSDHVYEF